MSPSFKTISSALAVAAVAASLHSSQRTGCFAAAGGGVSTGAATRLIASSEFNRRFLLEEQEWQQRLSVRARIFVVQADNAFAEPAGRVLVGQQLADRYLRRSGTAYAFQALGYVIAHEFGHQFQFRMADNLRPGARTELQADAIAGYWIGMRLREQVGQGASETEASQIARIARNAAFDIGDYVFDSPYHHGTPVQRHEAVSQGMRLGYRARFGNDFGSEPEARALFRGTEEIADRLLR